MLTYLLVWTVALGSLAIYGTSYIFPEVGRKNDLLWAIIGLFYALILLGNVGNISGSLLLGQTAGVSMLVWFGWQTLQQRREMIPEGDRTPVPDWLQKIVNIVGPLWTKLVGFFTAQLGIEPSNETAETTTTQGRLEFSEIKDTVLGWIDQLTQSSDSSTIGTDLTPTTDSEASDEDWGEEETQAEVEVEENSEAAQAEAVSPEETSAETVNTNTVDTEVVEAEIEAETTEVEAVAEVEETATEDFSEAVPEPAQEPAPEHIESETIAESAIAEPSESTDIQEPATDAAAVNDTAPPPTVESGSQHEPAPEEPSEPISEAEGAESPDSVGEAEAHEQEAKPESQPEEQEMSNWPPDPIN